MDDEIFGLIATLLCKEEGIESEQMGNILWGIFDKCYNKDKGEWIP